MALIKGKCTHCGKFMWVSENRETIPFCSRKQCKKSRGKKW